MATKKATLSDTENLAVGALGGILETGIQMPLITYKITSQDGRPMPKNIQGWYRGVVANAGAVAPITAFQMAVNGGLERLILAGDTSRELQAHEKIGAAMGAGAISSILYSPLDLVVIQQQKLATSIGGALSAVTKEHGMAALFRGFTSCAVRESIYTAGYLGVGPVATQHIKTMHPFFSENEQAARIAGSCFAGTMAAVMTHPVDTAKTCMQGDMASTTYRNAGSALGQVYSEHGIGGLYRGGAARTARICGAFFIVDNVREAAMKYKAEHFDS
ncbi:unnamed protein product [Bathycoccus prasinos]